MCLHRIAWPIRRDIVEPTLPRRGWSLADWEEGVEPVTKVGSARKVTPFTRGTGVSIKYSPLLHVRQLNFSRSLVLDLSVNWAEN